MTSNLKGAIAKSAGWAIAYIGFVLLIVFFEVETNNTEIGRTPFFVASGVYALAVFWFHFRSVKNKFLGALIASALALLVILIAVVVGVNFKFLLGGRL